jgi:hypothetical protein
LDQNKDLINEFETTKKEFDNKENDYDDIRLYRLGIEGLIGEPRKNSLFPSSGRNTKVF